MKLTNLPTLWIFGLVGLLVLTFLSQIFFQVREKLTPSQLKSIINRCTTMKEATITTITACFKAAEDKEKEDSYKLAQSKEYDMSRIPESAEYPIPELKGGSGTDTPDSDHGLVFVSNVTSNGWKTADYSYEVYFGLPGRLRKVNNPRIIAGVIYSPMFTNLQPGIEYQGTMVFTNKTTGNKGRSKILSATTTGTKSRVLPPDPITN